MDSLQCKQRFLTEIRTTFGHGGLNTSFVERELSDFHNFLERNFPYDQPGRVKKGAGCIGRQVLKMEGEEGITLDNVWILNENVQIDENGQQIPPSQSKYMWQPVGGPCIETVYGKNSSKIDIRSTIHLPLESKNALNDLLTLMKAVLKHNFIPG